MENKDANPLSRGMSVNTQSVSGLQWEWWDWAGFIKTKEEQRVYLTEQPSLQHMLLCPSCH